MSGTYDIEGFDFLNMASDTQLAKRLDNETIYFSGTVTKFNKNSWKQDRIFILTNAAAYNVKKHKVQRRIDFEDIDGFTKSNNEGASEFVIHVKHQYDYRFKAQKETLDDLLYVLKVLYYRIYNSNLKVYGVDYDNLKDFTTSKKDASKNISKRPPRSNILLEEELFKEERATTKMPKYVPHDVNMMKKVGDSGVFDMRDIPSERRSTSGTIYSKEKGKIVCMDDFEIKKVIGKGSFGKVYLVKKIDDGTYYAMKSMKKESLLDNDQIEGTIVEKKILKNNKHPFLVKMSYIFQTEDKVYFVMNFIRGGELFHRLCAVRRFDETTAKFYTMQIVLAIGYLHKQGLVYRDIKPENILIGEDGYLVLTDFGLAKKMGIGEMAQTFCGTPEYLAPEIIQEKGHGYMVDWWAIGILIYEMIVGFPPFYHKNQRTMFELIEKYPVKFPNVEKHGIGMSEECEDFITKLLEKNPSERLGAENGVMDLLSHPWFEDLDVDKVLNKQYEPPFIPELKDDFEDVSNFSKKFTSQNLKETLYTKKDLKKLEKHKSKFTEFDS